MGRASCSFAFSAFAYVAFLLPESAAAQTPATDSDQGGLDEIVVTAQKRAEGLSDVPISISAVKGEAIEAYAQTNLEQVSSTIPNLKITQTAIASRIAIRGIASGDNKGFEQSVAMFVDGVYFGRDQLSRLPLVDIERIEVLRGPQPTLFGKNAIAGAVSIVTRKPSDELEASVNALYEFNHKEAKLTGVLSGPLSQKVGARIVANYRKLDGYFFNTKQDRNEPNLREAFARGILDYDSGAGLTADLKIEYADFRAKGQPREVFGATGNYNAVFAGPLFVDTELDYVRADGGYLSNTNVFNIALNVNYELGDHTLSAVTGYVDYNVEETIDIDFVAPNLLDGSNLSESYKQISQEFRIASPGGDRLSYIAGLYYQHSKLDFADHVIFSPFFLNTPFRALGDTSNDRTFSQTSNLFSIFAQGEYALTDTLRVTIGARFNREIKRGQRALSINRGPQSLAALPTISDAAVSGTFRAVNIEAHSISEKLTENSLNPMANIQYDVTDDLLIYGSFARGTKAGGFDVRSNSTPTSTTVARPGAFQFDDERADNFEVGLKYKGKNLALSLALYRTKYADLQTSVFDGTLNFNVRNAARATTQGIEADARWAVGDHLTLSGGIAYLDFAFTDFPNGQCAFQQPPDTAGGFCNYAGQRNLLSPKWSGNVAADFKHDINDRLKFGAGFSADFSSSYVSSANLDPRTRQGGFVKIGARVSLGAVDDSWAISLIGRNLTNERIIQNSNALPLATTFTGNQGIAYSAIYDRPVNVALAFDLKF
jgi:iron complex outermembrane recepter protein